MANDSPPPRSPRAGSPAAPRPALDRVAVVDIGTNTVLLLVLDRKRGVLVDESVITRLGESVFERGALAPQAVARTRSAVVALARSARDAGAERVVAVGTEALRRARDGADFLADLERVAGLDAAWLLSGDREAELTIAASRRARGDGAIAVIDVGGGSTEVAWSVAGGGRGLSLPLGSVRLTEACLQAGAETVSPAELDALRRRSREGAGPLARALPSRAWARDEVVAVAGTATTLAALDQRLEPYDASLVEGYALTREALTRWIERLAALPLARRRELPGLEPGRADVIVAGAVVLDEVLDVLGAPAFRVSGRGVRHGAALALLDGREPV